MTFTLRQLHYFRVLASELHFGRAAHKLNISQPPLSASLRQLEEGLGAELFERNSRGVRLTQAGVAFLERITPALDQLVEARQVARLMAAGTAGSIRLGFVPTMIFRGLPHLLKQFRTRNPLVRLELMELNSTDQIEKLERRQIDVGFIHASPLPAGLVARTVAQERFVGCVAREHRLASRQHIELTELAGEDIIVFSRDYAAHYHDHIVGILREAGMQPHMGFELRHWFSVLNLIGQGIGVSLVPQCLVRAGIANVAFVDLSGGEACHEVACIWREADVTPAQDAFLAMAGAFFASRKAG